MTPTLKLPVTFKSQQEIVAKATPLERLIGIYFLINDGEIIYIGQSGDVHSRVMDHSRSRLFTFTHWSMIPCEQDRLDAVESIYIHTLQPIHNRQGNIKGEKSAPLRISALVDMGY